MIIKGQSLPKIKELLKIVLKDGIEKYFKDDKKAANSRATVGMFDNVWQLFGFSLTIQE